MAAFLAAAAAASAGLGVDGEDPEVAEEVIPPPVVLGNSLEAFSRS